MIQNSVNQLLGAAAGAAYATKKIAADNKANELEINKQKTKDFNKVAETNDIAQRAATYYEEKEAGGEKLDNTHKAMQVFGDALAKQTRTQMMEMSSANGGMFQNQILSQSLKQEIAHDQAMQRAAKMAEAKQNQANNNFIQTSFGKVYEKDTPALYNKLKETK